MTVKSFAPGSTLLGTLAFANLGNCTLSYLCWCAGGPGSDPRNEGKRELWPFPSLNPYSYSLTSYTQPPPQ